MLTYYVTFTCSVVVCNLLLLRLACLQLSVPDRYIEVRSASILRTICTKPPDQDNYLLKMQHVANMC